MSDLDELRALLAAATPGPWRFVPNQENQPDWDGDIHGGNDMYVAHDHEGLQGAVGNADAALIVWLRNHAESLLADSLDAAWAEAEAALPDGWLGPEISPFYPMGFETAAWHKDEVPGAGNTGRRTRACYGETAADALRALAAALRAGKP